MTRLLHHAARAVAPVPLLFVACTTAGAALAVQAGLLGLPLLLILVSWTAKYAFVVLEAAAHGLPTPVLSIEMANPWDERRPLAALAIAACVAGLAEVVRSVAGDGPATAFVAAAVLLAPASLALLAVEGSAWRALNPAAGVAVARALGATYVVVVALGWALVAAVPLLARAAPMVVAIALVQLGILAYVALLGGAVFEHRNVLGLDAIGAPERGEADAARAHAAARAAVASEAYGLVRVRKPDLAWQRLEAWLAAGGRRLDDCEALLAAADRWDDARIAERLRRELVTRLLALGRSGDALLAVEAAFRAGRRYTPSSARELVRLAQLAADLGHDATAGRLLDECGAAYEADPEVRSLRSRRGR